MELLVLYPPTKRIKGVEHHLDVQLMHLVAKGAHVILHKREKRGKESVGEESCLTTRHKKKQQKANKSNKTSCPATFQVLPEEVSRDAKKNFIPPTSNFMSCSTRKRAPPGVT